MHRRILRALAIDLAVLLVLLLAGEAIARAFYPPDAYFIFNRQTTGGYPIALNSHGLRDREFTWIKPAEVTRVLCLGNSTTFGSGVGLESTYPKQLEAMLIGVSPEARFEVINGGGQGNSFDEALGFLSENADELRPAVVVFGFSAGAIRSERQAAGPAGAPVGRERSLSSSLRRLPLTAHLALTRSRLYALGNAKVRPSLYALGVLRDRLDRRWGALLAYAFDVPGVDLELVERSYERLEAKFRIFVEEANTRNIKVLAVGLPTRFEISDAPRDNLRHIDTSLKRIDPLSRFSEASAGAGVPFLDMRDRLRRERAAMLDGSREWKDLYIPDDYIHLDHDGLEMVAEEILALLSSLSWSQETGTVPDRTD